MSFGVNTDEIKTTIENVKKSMKDSPIIISNNLDMRAMPVSKAVLDFRTNGAWQDFIAILLNNGYEINCRVNDDEIEITWKNKVEGIVITEKETGEAESEG